MRKNTSGRASAGFTLIEVMVVLAILASLIAAGTVMIRIAQAKTQENKTKGTINALAAAIESFRTDNNMPYPPTFAGAINVGGTKVGQQLGPMNDVNVGIESIYVIFRLKGIKKPDGVDDQIANIDDDKATPIGDMAKPDLFEYVDAWGNPLIYFNSRDYKEADKCKKYKRADGVEVVAQPWRNTTNGEFDRADSYQLFSMGPDQTPNTDDDLRFGH